MACEDVEDGHVDEEERREEEQDGERPAMTTEDGVKEQGGKGRRRREGGDSRSRGRGEGRGAIGLPFTREGRLHPRHGLHLVSE